MLTSRQNQCKLNLRCGVVAQLGERLNGIQEVRSSILLSSTRNFKGLRKQTVNPFSFFQPYFQPPNEKSCKTMTKILRVGWNRNHIFTLPDFFKDENKASGLKEQVASKPEFDSPR